MAKRHHGHKKHHGAMHHSHDRDGYGERHKGAMINDDMSAPALLPQHVIEKYYPAGHMYGMHMVDDLFDGVQKQMHEDARDFKKAFSPKKY